VLVRVGDGSSSNGVKVSINLSGCSAATYALAGCLMCFSAAKSSLGRGAGAPTTYGDMSIWRTASVVSCSESLASGGSAETMEGGNTSPGSKVVVNASNTSVGTDGEGGKVDVNLQVRFVYM
jgi:hypothetical protein